MADPARERFLARVRAATGRSADAPAPVPPAPPEPSPAVDSVRLAERFAAELERVHGTVTLARTREEARASLAAALGGASSLVRSPHAVLDELGLDDLARELGLRTETPERADVGITGCELAVAATGSYALSSACGRLAALLPPAHVVVLRASQLVPDLPDLYLDLAGRELPGAWGVHAGPSKSADIEQTMALGVHGPGVVHAIVLLDDGG